jgi:hypothetical protein
VVRDTTDGIDAVADELYGLHPGDFIAARDVWARQARHNGDRVLASKIAALRRPTTSAWMVNLLRRQAGEVIEQLVQLGAELREAQDQLAAADLRRLAAERHRLVLALTGQARRLAAAAGQDVDRTVLTEVEATLGAALADPALGAQVLTGRLVRPLEHVGFGPAVSPSGLVGGDREDADATTPAGRGGRGGLRAVRTPPASTQQAMKRQQERARAVRARELAHANEVVAAARRALAHTRQRVEEATAHREDAHRVVSELRERLTDSQRRAAEADLDERAAAAELAKAERAVEEAEQAHAALED